MKPFNLEEALAGKPVVTRDGNKVTQLHLFDIDSQYPLYGVVETSVWKFTKNGKPVGYSGNKYELFMAPEKVTKWVNVYKTENGYEVGQTLLHNTGGTAETSKIRMNDYIATVPITFEI